MATTAKKSQGPATRSGGVASNKFEKKEPEGKWITSYSKEELQKLSRQELRDLCKRLGMPPTGSDQDLRDRLLEKFEEDTDEAAANTAVAANPQLAGSPTIAEFLDEGETTSAAGSALPTVQPLPGFVPTNDATTAGQNTILQQISPEELPDDSFADSPAVWTTPTAVPAASDEYQLFVFKGFDGRGTDHEIYTLICEYAHDYLKEVPIEVLGTSMDHVGFRFPAASKDSVIEALKSQEKQFVFKGAPLECMEVDVVHMARFTVPLAPSPKAMDHAPASWPAPPPAPHLKPVTGAADTNYIDEDEDLAGDSDEASEASEVEGEVSNNDLMRRLITMEKRRRHDTKTLEKKIMTETRVMVSEAVDPLKDKQSDVQTSIAALRSASSQQGTALQTLEAKVDTVLTKRVDELERMIKDMHIKKVTHGGSTAVVGGLSSASSPAVAIEWVWEQTKKADIKGVTEVFHKGSNVEFNGMVFLKFDSTEARDRAIVAFNAIKAGLDNAQTFMNPDLPVTIRAPKALLFGLKNLLVEWGNQKGSIYVDSEALVLSVEGKPVVTANGHDFELGMEWLDPQWAQWQELQNDAKFQALLAVARDKLSKAKAARSKGKGRAAA